MLTDPAGEREQAATHAIRADGLGASTADPGSAPYVSLFDGAPIILAQGTPASSNPPRQTDVDTAVARICELIEDGGMFEDDLTNSELKEIVRIFGRLDADQATQAVARLTDREIGTIFDEMQSWGIGGFNGLSENEWHGLLADLAAKLDGAQLERVARAYGHPQEVADIVAAHGNDRAKVGFVHAYAEAASNAAQPGAWYENLGSATTRYGNEEARAVGTVLGSLGGDQAALREAFAALDPAQLDAVIGASMEMTSRQGTSNGGVGLPVYSFDDTRINAILDAAATSNDPALKARVFASAARALQQMKGVGGTLTPSTDADQTATSIAEHMSGLLRSDTRGIVAQLETIDPTDEVIRLWVGQMLAPRS